MTRPSKVQGTLDGLLHLTSEPIDSVSNIGTHKCVESISVTAMDTALSYFKPWLLFYCIIGAYLQRRARVEDVGATKGRNALVLEPKVRDAS